MARSRRAARIAVVAFITLAGATLATTAAVWAAGAAPTAAPIVTPTESVRLTAGPAAAAAAPGYFIDNILFSGAGTGTGIAQVRNSATGRLVTQDPAVRPLDIAAFGSNRRFVIALQVGDSCATRLYAATLSPRGQLGKLSRIGPTVHGLVVSLAAAADGNIIGLAVYGCGKTVPGYLAALDVRTQLIRRWGSVSLDGSSGSVAVSNDLSISADGKLLAFTGSAPTFTVSPAVQYLWVLSTTSAPGTVAERSRVVLSAPASAPALRDVVLSPNGATSYLCTLTGSTSQWTADLVAYRTADGKRLAAIAKLTTTGSAFQYGGTGCAMAADISGSDLLVGYPLHYFADTEHGPTARIARIHLATRSISTFSIDLPGSAGMSVAYGIALAW